MCTFKGGRGMQKGNLTFLFRVLLHKKSGTILFEFMVFAPKKRFSLTFPSANAIII